MSESPRIRDALEAQKEFNELCKDASEAERDELWLAAIDDPYFEPGLEAQELLERLGRSLGSVVAKSQTAVENTGAIDKTEVLSQTEIEKLLAEIEDAEPKDFELQKQCAADIEKFHGALDSYNTRRGRIPKQPSAKQGRELDLALRSKLPPSYIKEVAASPERARSLLDTLACKDGIRELTRQDMKTYLTTQLHEAIKKQLENYTPDQLADAIKASARPGLSQSSLEKLYIETYFKQANLNSAEAILDNYELFVRGILRILDMPETARYATGIIHFETPLLPAEGRYHHMVSNAAFERVDKPDLIRRRLELLRIDTAIAARLHMEALPIASNWRPDIPDGVDPSKLRIKNQRQLVLGSIASRVVNEQMGIAVLAIGQHTFQRRSELLRAIKEIQDGYSTDEGMSELLNRMMASTADGRQVTPTEFIRAEVYKRTASDDERAFIDAVFLGGSSLRSEADTYLSDLTINPLFQHEFGQPTKPDSGIQAMFDEHDVARYVRSIAETQGEDPEHLEATLHEMFAEGMHEITQSLGNGYRLGFFVRSSESKGGAWELSDAERQTVFTRVDMNLVQAAVDRLEQSHGLNRNYEIIPDLDNLTVFIVRPETTAEIQELHALNELLGLFGLFGDEWTDETGEVIIEASHFEVSEKRRRFMNRRGIQINLTNEDEVPPFAITFRKHPKNPLAFIGTLKSGDQQATFLIDPTLRVQLGRKYVENRSNFIRFNALCASILAWFATKEAIETEEGPIEDGRSSVTDRIAHLRFLQPGYSYSYDAWSNCLEAEGLDLEVLSALRGIKHDTDQKSTYVRAIESDDPNKPPLVVYPDK